MTQLRNEFDTVTMAHQAETLLQLMSVGNTMDQAVDRLEAIGANIMHGAIVAAAQVRDSRQANA